MKLQHDNTRSAQIRTIITSTNTQIQCLAKISEASTTKSESCRNQCINDKRNSQSQTDQTMLKVKYQKQSEKQKLKE